MKGLGRALQQLGLILPPLSIVLQLAGSVDVRQMLALLVASVCLFFIGRIIEGYSR
jgi:hypothetical protein